MQLGRATLVELNAERNAHKNVWQIVLFYFGLSRETPEMARLHTRADTAEKERLEWELKYRVSESEKESLRNQLTTAGVRMGLLTWYCLT